MNDPITVGGHLRIRPFNTADSYPEQRLDNDLCQAVVAGRTSTLRAGLAAGGEVTPVRSAGMVIAESAPWPVTDLRVDWHDDPVGQLAALWRVWEPQAASYVRRALHPARA